MTTRYSVQAPPAVVMVRPHCFHSNRDTLHDNAFQQSGPGGVQAHIASAAFEEVTAMARQLEQAGIQVHLFEDTPAEGAALGRFCTHFNFEPMVFDAADAKGQAVYHTNVLMCIGTDLAMSGSDMISHPTRREEVMERLAKNGRELITLSPTQIADFAGNALELQGTQGRVLAGIHLKAR